MLVGFFLFFDNLQVNVFNNLIFWNLFTFFVLIFHLLVDESMKKKASCTKIKVFSKDCIFHIAIFYWFILHFSHSFLTKYQIWGQIYDI
jgi:hypothetical protein